MDQKKDAFGIVGSARGSTHLGQSQQVAVPGFPGELATIQGCHEIRGQPRAARMPNNATRFHVSHSAAKYGGRHAGNNPRSTVYPKESRVPYEKQASAGR